MASVQQRFLTEPPTATASYAMAQWRERFAELARLIELRTPDSRERSLALTKLEEAKYWVNQSVILEDNDHQRAISEGENE